MVVLEANCSGSIAGQLQQHSRYVCHCVFVAQTSELPPVEDIVDAYVLLNLGDSVTTDHISPAGSIARNSPAARYLAGRG